MDVLDYQPGVGQGCWLLEYPLRPNIKSQITSFKIQINIKFQCVVEITMHLITL